MFFFMFLVMRPTQRRENGKMKQQSISVQEKNGVALFKGEPRQGSAVLFLGTRPRLCWLAGSFIMIKLEYNTAVCCVHKAVFRRNQRCWATRDSNPVDYEYIAVLLYTLYTSRALLYGRLQDLVVLREQTHAAEKERACEKHMCVSSATAAAAVRSKQNLDKNEVHRRSSSQYRAAL